MGAPVTTAMVAAEHPSTGPTERESVDCGVLPSTTPVLPMVQLERSRPSTPFTSELGTVGNLVSYFLGELAHGGVSVREGAKGVAELTATIRFRPQHEQGCTGVVSHLVHMHHIWVELTL